MLSRHGHRLTAAAVTAATLVVGCLDWDTGPVGGVASTPTDGGDASESSTDGLVAHWTFDEGEGTVARDSSGGGHDAVLVGGPAWTAGRLGGALSFDGNEHYVEAQTLRGSSFPTRGTLSLWLRGSFEGDFRPIFDTLTAERRHLALRNHTAGKLQFHGRAADGGVAFNGVFDVPALIWTHVVLVWDPPARAASAYRNGALVFSAADLPEGWSPDEQEVTFARRPGGGGFVGTIDEIRLYDRPLSSAEIARLP